MAFLGVSSHVVSAAIKSKMQNASAALAEPASMAMARTLRRRSPERAMAAGGNCLGLCGCKGGVWRRSAGGGAHIQQHIHASHPAVTSNSLWQSHRPWVTLKCSSIYTAAYGEIMNSTPCRNKSQVLLRGVGRLGREAGGRRPAVACSPPPLLKAPRLLRTWQAWVPVWPSSNPTA